MQKSITRMRMKHFLSTEVSHAFMAPRFKTVFFRKTNVFDMVPNYTLQTIQKRFLIEVLRMSSIPKIRNEHYLD